MKKNPQINRIQLERAVSNDYDDSMLEDDDDDINLNYEIEREIGRGAYSIVYSAIKRKTKDKCAIKVINKREINSESLNQLKKEADILKNLKHPNIIKMLDFRETQKKIYMVSELVPYGTLQTLIESKIANNSKFTQQEISSIMRGLFKAVEFMHYKDVLHRDIKPENILIPDVEDLSKLKLADFGLSVKFAEADIRNETYEELRTKTLNTRCGTLLYMAPELVFKKTYSKPVDIWSCGIIFFMLQSGGRHPLHVPGESSNSFLKKLEKLSWFFPEDFPDSAKQLFLKLTDVTPSERYNPNEALRHPLISEEGGSNSLPMTMNDMLCLFHMQNDFLAVIKAVMLVKYMQKIPEIRADQKKLTFHSMMKKSQMPFLPPQPKKKVVESDEPSTKSSFMNSSQREDKVGPARQNSSSTASDSQTHIPTIGGPQLVTSPSPKNKDTSNKQTIGTPKDFVIRSKLYKNPTQIQISGGLQSPSSLMNKGDIQTNYLMFYKTMTDIENPKGFFRNKGTRRKTSLTQADTQTVLPPILKTPDIGKNIIRLSLIRFPSDSVGQTGTFNMLDNSKQPTRKIKFSTVSNRKYLNSRKDPIGRDTFVEGLIEDMDLSRKGEEQLPMKKIQQTRISKIPLENNKNSEIIKPNLRKTGKRVLK